MKNLFKPLIALNVCVTFLAFYFIGKIFDALPANYWVIALGSVVAAVISSLISVKFIVKPNLAEINKTPNAIVPRLKSYPLEAIYEKTQLTMILSSMVEGVVIIDADEKIILLSPQVSTMLDLRSKDTIGKAYWEIIRNEEIISTLKDALREQKAIYKDITIIFPSESFFRMQISPVLSEDGEFLGVVAVFHDISEIKRLENLRSEFVANVSHELKTPLTSIKGFVETLKGGALSDEKLAKRFLDIIQVQTEKLENLVTDILTLSTLESKDVKMKFESISIVIVLTSVVDLYKTQIEKKNLTLEMDLGKNLKFISVDCQKIEQVFSNLLDNAIKFTPAGGEIAIRAYQENSFVRIDVKDSGVGIAEEHLPRLFERFYRVDKSRSREFGGTGLGLAIVKHIVQAHNGKITVTSQVDNGSIFSVFLPISSSAS